MVDNVDENETLLDYIYLNYYKFLLFLFVFVIIYFVDYISYINTIMYSPQQYANNNKIKNKKIKK
jgi:hypothetical protein